MQALTKARPLVGWMVTHFADSQAFSVVKAISLRFYGCKFESQYNQFFMVMLDQRARSQVSVTECRCGQLSAVSIGASIKYMQIQESF